MKASASSTRICSASIWRKILDPNTGEIFARRATRSTRRRCRQLLELGFDELPILDIDHINIGPYIRNTLAVDKNGDRARRRCSTSIASCVRASRRPSRRRKRCSIRCSSIPSATTRRPSAA